MKTLKLTKKTMKEIDKAVAKIIKDYGCVLVALQFDDEDFIKECSATGHKKYHNPKTAYSLIIE